jgi:Acetyltransferase (GNAT) domain
MSIHLSSNFLKNDSRYTIRRAETRQDREAVYRLRYEVYVEEMGRTQVDAADHRTRRIVDSLDENGVLLAAFDREGNVIGTLRTNHAAQGSLGHYEHWYGMAQYAKEAHPYATTITTKLILRPEYRRTTLALRLITHGYEEGFAHSRYNFLDCIPELEGFYKKLGCIVHRPRFLHPEYGELVPLVMPMHDLSHLRTVRSPLARHCEQLLHAPPTPHRLTGALAG